MASFSQDYYFYNINGFSCDDLPIDRLMTSSSSSDQSNNTTTTTTTTISSRPAHDQLFNIASALRPFSDDDNNILDINNNGAVTTIRHFDYSDMFSCSSSSSSSSSFSAAAHPPLAASCSSSLFGNNIISGNIYDGCRNLMNTSATSAAAHDIMNCHQQLYDHDDHHQHQQQQHAYDHFLQQLPRPSSDFYAGTLLMTTSHINWEIHDDQGASMLVESTEEPTTLMKVASASRYSAEERKDRILRYLKKRSQRNFNKTIKYACRKTLADKRVRVRGRFAKNINDQCCEDGDDHQTLAMVKTSDYNMINNLQEPAELCCYNVINPADDQQPPYAEEWLEEAIASLVYYHQSYTTTTAG